MQNKNRLVLIDGYGMFFRAFYATSSLTRSDGLPVNGVYGFIRMLLNVIVDLNTTHIAIVFDTGKKNFRHDKYPEYKANRPPVPEAMIPQFPIIREVAEVLHIKSIEKDGYEADDIIATLSKEAEKEGFEVLIVGVDKDLMQLVDDNVKMFDIAKKKIIDTDAVVEKLGVYPKQVLDYLSLLGDASDNVPGVPSIGGKTAVQLVNEYGNIDGIVKHLDDIQQKSRREAIKNNLDKLYLSRDLIALCEDVKLDETLNDLVYKSFNVDEFKEFLNKMEFFSIVKYLDQSFNNEDKEQGGSKSQFEYKKICTINELEKVINEINSKNKHFYFNFLTNNIVKNDDVVSFAFLDENKKYIYQLDIEKQLSTDLFETKTESNLKFNDVVSIVKSVLQNEKIKKITYNFKKNLRIVDIFDFEIDNFDDLSVMSYLLDAGKFSQDLSSLMTEYIENNTLIKTNNIANNIRFQTQYEKEKDITNISMSLFDFACAQIEYFYFLYDILNYRLQNEKDILELYNTIEKPLVTVLANMEKSGVMIATNELNNLSVFFNQKISEIEHDIYKAAGCEFNIASPKQLADVLFNKMALPTKQKASKSGNFSTNMEVLESLYLDGYEIADDILEYRHYMKLKNTYTDILPKMIDSQHRLHTTFLNTNVITGRLSSNNPNLQNIPIKTIDGERIRQTFIAKDGFSFIGADYSQIELRILAHYANVVNLIKAFNDGVDIHSRTAKEVFKTEYITPEMRQKAKAINFSIIYGTTSYGLAKRLGFTPAEAQKYMDNYFALYPEVKEYMMNTKEFVKQNGYSKTLFNRRCHINLNVKGQEKTFLERLAINSPIQGTGADIIKKAMNEIFIYLKQFGDDANIVLQIHDELLIEVKNELVEEICKKVKDIMEHVVQFKVPLIANAKIAKNWKDAH